MHKVYKISLAAIITCFLSSMAMAQDTTGVTSVDVDLVNIFNQKTPKKYKIAAIKVTGNRFFDENLLVSISGLNIGDEVTIPGGDAFAKAINKLWGQNYFSDVQIYLTKLEAKNLSIEINVTERPRLSKFEFIGVKKGEKEDLMGKTGLVVNRIVTENMKRSAIEAITKYYAEKSYLNVKVSIDSKIDSSFGNTVALYFNVAKGNKVRINNIAFVGNTVDGLKLKKQLKETKEMSRLTLKRPDDKGKYSTGNVYTFNDYLLEKGYLTFSKTKRVLDPYVRLKLFASAKFNEKKFQEDKERLLEYYNALGYRDAAFDGKTAIDTNQQGNINIGIKINEGHKYYFGDIRWRGNTKYSDSTLTTILGIRKGDDYNLDILNKKLGKNLSPEGGDISGLYMDDGYLFFRTEPIETAVYNDTIDYEIRVVEGPQATWKNIKITGNEKTKEYVIRRELRTLPGEKFSRSDLIRSQRELGQLNYFNQEKINPNIVPNQEDGTVDVTWQLEEKSSDQLELSAGFGGGIGLTGTVGITFNNFSLKNIFKKTAWDPLPMGDGQKVSLRVQSNGRAFRSYNFSFTEPWLGGKKRNGFTFSLFDTKFANAYDPTTGTYTSEAANTSYIKTSGVSVNLAKQLKWPDDYFSLSLGLSYARYKLKNYYIDQVNLPGFNNGYSNNLSFKASLQRSSVGPNPLFPTSGSNFLMSLQITPPYSLLDKSIVNSSNPYTWVEYHKWRLNTEWYVPIGKPSGAEKNKQFILKAAAKFGYLGKYNPKLKISPFERFQVGDAGLSNQYALLGYDIIAQRGYPVYQNSDPKINPDQQGASEYFTIFNKYVLELRYPLSLNPSSTIYALTFFEAANGWFSAKEYNPFRLRRSVGLGMRFYLPMFGLLGFDYGIGLDRINGTNKLKDAARFTFMLGFEPE